METCQPFPADSPEADFHELWDVCMVFRNSHTDEPYMKN